MNEENPSETPETLEAETGYEIYDSRSYIINITFHGPISNLHIEQYGKPINPPPPPGGGNP